MRVCQIVACCLIVLLFVTLFASGVTVSATALPAEMQARYDSERSGDYSRAATATGTTSGTKLWDLDITPYFSPAVVNGVVYVASHNNNLYALNATTGTKLWGFTSTGGIISPPAVADGVVYIGDFGWYGDTLYALNATTGTKYWNFTFTGGITSPAVAGRVVYIGAYSTEYNGTQSNGTLYALDEVSGSEKWNVPMKGFIDTSPAVADGVVYIGSDNGTHNSTLHALNATTGNKLWDFTPPNSFITSPAVANGLVYVGSSAGSVYALDAQKNGSETWAYKTEGRILYSSPAIANGVVYVVSELNNSIYALNATNGAKLWSNATEGTVESDPVVANGMVYVGSYDNNVYALNASTGAKVWSYQTGGRIYYSPAIVNGVVYVGSNDGYFYAIGIPATNALAVLIPLGWSFFGLALVGLLIWFQRRSPHSLRVASLSWSNLSKLKANKLVVATVVWFVVYVSLSLVILSSSTFPQVVPFTLWWLATIFFVLAIIGIITYYFPKKGHTPLPLGPLFGIVGWVFDVAAVFALVYYSPAWSFGLAYSWSGIHGFLLFYILSVGYIYAPLFGVYWKQGTRAPTRVTKAVLAYELSLSFSNALKSLFEDLDKEVSGVRKLVRKRLALLTSALPAIFLLTNSVVGAGVSDLNTQQVLISAVWGGFGLLFLAVAITFFSQLKTPQFSIAINPSPPDLNQIAEEEQRAIAKGFRQQLAFFVPIFAFAAVLGGLLCLLYSEFVSGIPATLTASYALLLGSILLCFIAGYRVLIGSSVPMVVSNEALPQSILKQIIGVLPAKVRVSEAQSILMAFSIGTPNGGATSAGKEPSTPHADGIQPQYQVELQAAGVTIDGAKQRTISEVPAIFENVWSCSFPSAGRQVINLLVKEVRPARGEKGDGVSYHPPVFTYVHPVRVEGNFTLSTDNLISIAAVLVSATTILVNVLPHTPL